MEYDAPSLKLVGSCVAVVLSCAPVDLSAKLNGEVVFLGEHINYVRSI